MTLLKTTGVDPLGTRHSSPARVQSTLDSRVLAGKGKTVARKQWADGPWPLIENPFRTQNTGHPVQHIVKEVLNTHNAMLRGLNVLYLQAPFVRLPVDVADFCFLARVWASWVRDYHNHKEDVMIPKFEDALRLERGSLRLTFTFSEAEGEGKWIGSGNDKGKVNGEENGNGKGKGKEKEKEEYTAGESIPILLQNVFEYATETHADPTSYSPSTLQHLLSTLANLLIPHLHGQIPLLQQMQDLCLDSPSPSPSPSSTTTTTTPSTTNSSSSSSPPSSTPSSTSLPSSTLPPRPPKPRKTPTKSTLLTQALLSLTSTTTSSSSLSSSSSSSSLDPYTTLPLLVRLRDATYDPRTADGGVWPRLSVPALHLVADRLSQKHAGAWRFLPCDVWGRPRELGFLGDEDEDEDGDGDGDGDGDKDEGEEEEGKEALNTYLGAVG
ncbi:hypothetical protein K445DRAFT_321105 [Daldinia sp. EC12]|nr:hypothetical protein K445DRAFT_321105 [Daldinia sp. EC12]